MMQHGDADSSAAIEAGEAPAAAAVTGSSQSPAPESTETEMAEVPTTGDTASGDASSGGGAPGPLLEPARRRVSALARSIARNERAIIELRAQLHAALEAHSRQLTVGLQQILSDRPEKAAELVGGTPICTLVPLMPFQHGTARLSAPGSLGGECPAVGGASDSIETAAAAAQRRRQELRIERERRLKKQLRESLSEHMTRLTAGLSGLFAPGQQPFTAAAGELSTASCDVGVKEGQQQQAGDGDAVKKLEQRLQQAEAAAAVQATLYAEAVARADQLAQECATLRAAAAKCTCASSKSTAILIATDIPPPQGPAGSWEQQQQQQQQQQQDREAAGSRQLVEIKDSRGPDSNSPAAQKRRTLSEPNLSLVPSSAESGGAPRVTPALIELDAAYRLFCDNRTLAWECFHLQALLVRERLLAKASAQVGALQLAAQCVGLQQRLREAYAELQLLQMTLPAGVGAAADGLVGNVARGSDVVVSGVSGATDQVACNTLMAVAALRQSVGAMLDDSRDETESLLTALAHCQERVAAHFDDAGWAENVQAQLDQIRAAEGPEQLKKVLSDLHSEPTVEAGAAAGEQLAAVGAVQRGQWCSSYQKQSCAEAAAAASASGHTVPRCFVTTPSGHITPVASRRTTLMGHQPSRVSAGPCLATAAAELAARTSAGRRRTGAASVASDSGLAAVDEGAFNNTSGTASGTQADAEDHSIPGSSSEQQQQQQQQRTSARVSHGVHWHASVAGRPSRATGEGPPEGAADGADGTLEAKTRTTAAARFVSEMQQAAMAALERLTVASATVPPAESGQQPSGGSVPDHLNNELIVGADLAGSSESLRALTQQAEQQQQQHPAAGAAEDFAEQNNN